MSKKTHLLLILSGIIVFSFFNSKTEIETFIDKIETPAEILSRCEQDIDTMNPDNIDTVKHILKIIVQVVDIGSKQLKTSVNLLKSKPKPKKSIFCSLKQLLKPRYEPIKGLSWQEKDVCCKEASYKMNILVINQNIKELLASLSKHDWAIIQNTYQYMLGKIQYHNDVLLYFPMILLDLDFYNH